MQQLVVKPEDRGLYSQYTNAKNDVSTWSTLILILHSIALAFSVLGYLLLKFVLFYINTI